ncbi:MAG: S-layer homology domain-containing protein, partial [Bacteroidaceae bacterium]|nr:S-layer homology domain-containing protein [Bacteroidaceae bacterium]
VRNNANAAWAEGYIESCAAQGIVSGVGGGKFAPNGNVTGVQLAKMLLVSLGYKSENEGFTGNAWATNVNVRAAQKGLYKGLEKMDTNAAITRDNAAQMVWNALNAYEVEYKTTLVADKNGQLTSQITVQDKVGNESLKTKVTLLQDKYEANTDHEGLLVGFTYNDTKGEWTYYVQEDAQHTVPYKSSNDYTGLFRQNVSVVYKEKSNGTVDSVYGIYADVDETQVLATGLMGDLDDVSNKDSIKINGTSYDLNAKANSISVYYFQNQNGQRDTEATAAGNLYELAKKGAETLDAFKFVAIDLNADNDIDAFVVYPYAVGQVNLLNKSKIGVKDMDKSYAVVIDTATKTLDLDDVDTYKDVAKDDYVVYTPAHYTATNKASVEKVATVLNSTVSRVSGSDVTIDGKTYTNYKKNAEYTAGSKVSDAVIVNDYIFLVDSTGAVNADDYALVVGYSNGSNSVNGKQAKLLFSDGKKQVVDIKEMNEADVGDLVTYTKNSSNEYTLKKADTTNAKNTGFDKIVDVSTGYSPADKDVSSGKIKYIKGDVIADDAIIFVRDKDGNSYDNKVISGAQLKKLAPTNITVKIAYADENSSNGYDTVKLAYITSTSKVKSGDSKYGYVVAKPGVVENKDGDKVVELQVWTEDGKVETFKCTDNTDTFSKLAKRDIIEYTVNVDGDIDGIEAVIHSETSNSAINSYDGQYVRFYGSSDRYEIVKDTVILYVDNDEVVGYEKGDIQIANDMINGGKYPNACYIANSTNTDELDLLVVDINNDMANMIDEDAVATVTLPAGITDTDLKVLPNGVYIPTDTTFAPAAGGVSGKPKDNIIFKFAGTGKFTLKIKNDAGTEVYSEDSGNLTAEGGHYFYITLNPVNTNKGTEKGTWASPVTEAPAGDYTFTITQSNTTVLTGSFTVA